MKKLGIVAAVLVLLFIWQLVLIGRHIFMDQHTEANLAIQQAKQDFPIKTINSVTEYRGQKSLEVLQAVLDSGTKVWIWVPEQKGEGAPISANVADGYSKKQILSAFEKKIPYKKIISIHLGLVNQTDPAWEITYLDPNGHYVFSYFGFYTGKSLSSPISLN